MTLTLSSAQIGKFSQLTWSGSRLDEELSRSSSTSTCNLTVRKASCKKAKLLTLLIGVTEKQTKWLPTAILYRLDCTGWGAQKRSTQLDTVFKIIQRN